MQAGGSHANLPGCACLVHDIVDYLIAGLASHAFEIQVVLRSGSGSTQMYLVYPSELESLFIVSARQLIMMPFQHGEYAALVGLCSLWVSRHMSTSWWWDTNANLHWDPVNKSQEREGTGV